tara:strand:- start:1560 stop:1913 length:354 start_codon:yes stop_codon:yes gene_type:complete
MTEEEKQYWSIEELVEMTEQVQEGELEYKDKIVKFQWCELAESEEPKLKVFDEGLSEQEKNEGYIEMGKERTLLMMAKADEKSPDGPSLASVWDKIPSTLKYTITNTMMGIQNNPNE